MRFNFNKFSNREQILLFGLIILIFISALIFVISWLNTKNQSLEKENQNIVSRLNYIESIPARFHQIEIFIQITFLFW